MVIDDFASIADGEIRSDQPACALELPSHKRKPLSLGFSIKSN